MNVRNPSPGFSTHFTCVACHLVWHFPQHAVSCLGFNNMTTAGAPVISLTWGSLDVGIGNLQPDQSTGRKVYCHDWSLSDTLISLDRYIEWIIFTGYVLGVVISAVPRAHEWHWNGNSVRLWTWTESMDSGRCHHWREMDDPRHWHSRASSRPIQEWLDTHGGRCQTGNLKKIPSQHKIPASRILPGTRNPSHIHVSLSYNT